MTKIYLQNGFPRRLIYNKIEELKKRDFQPSSLRQERENEIRNNSDKNYNLILTYSSRRCDSVARKLPRTLKEITPDFRVHL